jgi:predicted RNA-binding protein (TIGR00451 family)
LIYCRPDRNERTRLNRALDRWGAFEFFNDKALILQKDDIKKIMVCLVNSKIEQLMADMIVDPYGLGLVIGQLRKQFIPSIAGADLFARHGKRNKFYVVVSEKAEKLVLYGRDILGESIVEASDDLDENELVILLNRSFEAIAIGRTRFSGNAILQKGKVTISTVADAGYYLRDEG